MHYLIKILLVLLLISKVYSQNAEVDQDELSEKINMTLKKYYSNQIPLDEDTVLEVFSQYRKLDLEDISRIKLDNNFVQGDLITIVHKLALEKNVLAIDEILLFGLSDYSNSTEGSEYTNELIWKLFEDNPKLVLDRLNLLQNDNSSKLITKVFLNPIHDGFDFISIKDSLNNYKPKKSFKKDFNKIRNNLISY